VQTNEKLNGVPTVMKGEFGRRVSRTSRGELWKGGRTEKEEKDEEKRRGDGGRGRSICT